MKKLIGKVLSAVSAAAVTAAGLPYIAPVKAADTVFPYTIEGEKLKGADLWTSIYETKIPDYSGEGFWYLTNASGSFTVTVPEDAMYQLTVRGAQILSGEGGARQQAVKVNGVKYTIQAGYSAEWRDYDFGMIRLNKGENTIEFINEYGYMAIDTVTVSEAVFPDLSKATSELCDPKATDEAKAVMKYLHSVYGTNILSGQQQIYGGGNQVQTTIRYDENADKCTDQDGVEYEIDKDSYDKDEQGHKFPWHCTGPDGQVYTYSSQNRNYTYNNYDLDVNLVYELTGKYPAIQGFDFGSYCPCYAWDDGVAGRMIEWTNEKGGICTASWHVNVPTTMADYTLGEPLDFSKTTYSEKTDFKTANCMVEGTVEYEYFQLCMKNLAAELQKLQDAGVPVIFRPFHEAEGNPSHTDDPIDGSGAWFWWAKEGAVVYKQIWALLQDTLENEYGLHNLIWEQNLYAWSDSSAEWYSGDDRVDIVAFDKYNTQYNRHDGKTSGPNLDAEAGIFYKIHGYVKGNKMVAMAENDSVPSMKNLTVEHAAWLYFCPWYDSQQAYFVSGENYQDHDEFKALYNSDYCITLDELPADLFKGGTAPTSTTSSAATTTTKASTTVTTTVLTTTASATGTAPAVTMLGDANCDKKVSVADAVAILQAIANKDKFALTPEGAANADCYNTGDGVTANDALAIQKLDAKAIDKLPEIAK
ncbi:MAG: beta-mannosidase [Ruminococcus sp.]|nr:beta-mannosidase [Ruminococcus sp.]